MIYFTSDLHLGHRGIIAMRKRPFADIEEMNRVLVSNFNAVVHKNDTVYILGDIAHHMQVEDVNKIIRNMNGKKILIKGNHDKEYDSSLFEEICDFKTVSLNGTNFSLMHYPMLSCIYIRADESNIGSNAVIRKNGFEFVKKETGVFSRVKPETVTLNCYIRRR